MDTGTRRSSRRRSTRSPAAAPEDATAQFIAAADGFCADYHAQEEPARQANDGSRDGQLTYLGTVARLLDQLARRLNELSSPPPLEPAVGEYVAGISRLSESVAAMREARARDDPAYYERAKDVAAQSEDSRRRAQSIGFKVCGT